jgi:hypothetical protein
MNEPSNQKAMLIYGILCLIAGGNRARPNEYVITNEDVCGSNDWIIPEYDIFNDKNECHK